jgi:hypothetical protein
MPASSKPGPKPGRAPTRGRPPKRVYINVLVKASTREALTRMKAAGELRSQGEVIDSLVTQALTRRAG